MSGKKALDFIALSQAAGAVARKTLHLQCVYSQRPSFRVTPNSQASLSHQDSSSENTGDLNSFSQERTPSSLPDAHKQFLSANGSGASQLNRSIQSQPARYTRDATRIAAENSQDSFPRGGLTGSSDVHKPLSENAAADAHRQLSRHPVKQNDEPAEAEANETPDQGLEHLYSDLFHSPRTANLLNVKRKRGSAWANVEFRKSSSLDQNDTNNHDSQDVPSFRVETPVQPASSSQNLTQDASSRLDEETQSSKAEVELLSHPESPVIMGTDQLKDSVTAPQPERNPEPSNKLQYEMRESTVPSTRLGRIWQYGGLATSLAFGAAGEGFRRSFGSNKSNDRPLFLSDSNMEAIVSKLSRMRGAALKLGQMISFQDLKMLPAPIYEVLQRVQDSADFMPAWQRDKVLQNNLGAEWRELFTDFEEKPLAAASIGQVHAATMKSSGMPVAVKIQYPGVANSIDSDLNNLALLLTASRLLPKGLYLDKTIANARTELAWECDYIREGKAARHFASLLSDDTDTFTVPQVIESTSGPQVLTLERMYGVCVTKVPGLSQNERDWIATNILRLCLRELFEFRYMQTDPNWTNFLFNKKSHRLELLDFGASREFPAAFTDPYCKILISAAEGDRKAIADLSVSLGYLTGHESRTMRDAHVDSVLTLAEPFANSSPDVYDFRNQTITDRVRALIPVMLRERLAPPPEETYSLHRKLSGAFLLCARLESRVAAKELFNSALHKWRPVSALT